MREILRRYKEICRFSDARVDEKNRSIVLTRIDGLKVLVPFNHFNPPVSDFRDVSVEDYGHTVRIGRLEASADGILREFCEDYRTLVDGA